MKKSVLLLCCAMLIACSKAPVTEQQQLERTAHQGDVLAQKNLGDMYANGTGVPKDETKAAEWYQKAADQGDADAQNKLGFLYEHGAGVPKDEVEAAV